jgi:putative restriction endonuclease
MSVDWLARVASIKTNNKVVNGFTSYAPNKPLLLLYLISNLYNKHSSKTNWVTVNKELGEILSNYGNKANALDPFFRLRSDKLFEVPGIDSSGYKSPQSKGYITFINEFNPEGYLPKDFEVYLLQDNNIQKVIGLVLHKFFSKTIHDLVLSDLKLPNDYYPCDIPKGEVNRGREFAKKVLDNYNHRCLFCDYYGVLNSKYIGIDAAHIVMFSRNGPNVIENGLSLCTLCHRLFDRGVLSLDDSFKILISPLYTGKLSVKINEPIVTPSARMIMHAKWHRTEIFNG